MTPFAPASTTGRPTVAVVGAVGRFAQAVVHVMAMRTDCWGEIRLLSPTVTTRTLTVRGREQPIEVLTEKALQGVDIALFNLPGPQTAAWTERAVAAGAVVVDASHAHRFDDQVPLVVPGINGERALERPRGIVSLPGPVTWALIDAAHVLNQGWELQLLVVTGLIAAASHSDRGIARLRAENEAVLAYPTAGEAPGDVRAATSDLPGDSPFPAPLAMNVIPWVGRPGDGGWTSTELGLRQEIVKILEIPHVPVVATLVQVPVVSSHSMSIHARCARSIQPEKVRRAIIEAPSLVILDDVATGEVPTPIDVAGIDPRFVGRVRQPEGLGHTIDLFLSADTIRRGAAAMVETAELVAADLARR